MDDREMLEWAAKAAGITGKMHKTLGGWDCIFISGTNHPWQPLYDDGDALRLAVKLNLAITVNYGVVLVDLPQVDENGMDFPSIHEEVKDDPYAATRRAIVRAAAAMGKEGK